MRWLWPPQSARVQGFFFGLGMGGFTTVMVGVIGQAGWMSGLVTGVLLGSVGGVYVANAMKSEGEQTTSDEQPGTEGQPDERLRPSAESKSEIDTKRWEFFALTLVPLLTVPILFAVDSLALTLSVLFVLALASPFLLRRLKSNPSQDPR
jgi:hypothetical protein